MTDRWSDLGLWPAIEPEVSPLREEHRFDGPDCGVDGCGREVGHVGDHKREPGAVARSTDPGTSWEAARSITPEKLRESQIDVLNALRRYGPMNDEDLYDCLRDAMSPSGARTRRSELVAMGLVRDSGRKDVLRSGRRAIVWEAV